MSALTGKREPLPLDMANSVVVQVQVYNLGNEGTSHGRKAKDASHLLQYYIAVQ